MKKGDKVIAYWVSNDVGKIVYVNKDTERVDIKYPNSKALVSEHISRVRIVQ